VLALVDEIHDALNAGPVVPAAVEDDDLARGGELLDVALGEQLRLLALRRRGERDDAKDARADPLGDCLDRSALALGVTSLKDDDDARAVVLNPVLQVAQLDLQLAELLLVILALEATVAGRSLGAGGVSSADFRSAAIISSSG
jgi:hypothetical protein